MRKNLETIISAILLLDMINDVFGTDLIMLLLSTAVALGCTTLTPWNNLETFQPEWDDVPFIDDCDNRVRNESSDSYASSSIHVGEYALYNWDTRHDIDRSESNDSFTSEIVGNFNLHSWDGLVERRTRSISL